MKISPVLNYSFVRKNQNNSSASLKYNNPLSKDTVSFTSKSLITNAFGENIKQATNIGRQVYNKLSRGAQPEELISLIHQEYPQVAVRPMSELDIEDKFLYFAFYTRKINSDLSPVHCELFIDFQNHNNPILNMISACDTAHEYTHLIQSYNPKTIEEYKTLSNSDKEYLEVVAGFGDSIFKYFDTKEQTDLVKGVLDTNDVINIQRYGKIVPRKKDVTKNMMFADSSYKNEKEFRAKVNAKYDDFFEAMSEQLLTAPDNQVLPRLKEKYRQIVASGGLDKLKQDVKKFITISARNKKEAYATESQVAKTILKTTDSLNIDGFPLYYQMLETAFKLS